MVHAGLMSERSVLVTASQHQQPAEVSGKSLPQETWVPLPGSRGWLRFEGDLGHFGCSKRNQRLGDAWIHAALAEGVNCCGCSPSAGQDSRDCC